MKKILIMLVLVLSVIKTNAQSSPFYYYKGERKDLAYSNDKILVKISNDDNSRQALLAKINSVQNLQIMAPESEVKGEYYAIRISNTTQSAINSAIQLFLDEPYVLSASQCYEADDQNWIGIADDIFVRVNPNANIDDAERILSQYGYVAKKKDKYFENVYQVFYPKSASMNVMQIANALFESSLFEFAEPNFVSHLENNCATTDPHFASQWGLENTAQLGGTPGFDINVCPAWTISTGTSGIRVAIVDDGVDLTHPDLTLALGYDATGGGSLGAPSSSGAMPHGTNCAGIVAAKQNNGIGVSGVAPNCTIVPVRVNGGGTVTDAQLADGINWAAAHADILNMSWSFSTPSWMIDAAISSAYYTGRGGLGCVIVMSAGNFDPSRPSTGVKYPATSPYVITVGAINMCGERKSYTSCDGENWGSCYGPEVDLAAPGVKIWSTDIQGSGGYDPGSDYFYAFNGTSAAAPHVAGVAALMLSVNPCLDVAEVRSIMQSTANKIGIDPYTTFVPGGPGYPSTYKNDYMGFGSVNAGKSVTLAHDVYRQNENITSLAGSYASASIHKLYAGSNVSAIKPTGDYIIGTNAIISFTAQESIELMPGFMADNGSLFTAEIAAAPCTTGYLSWRQTANDSSSNSSSIKASENIIISTIAAKDHSDIKIYPNPAHDRLNVSYSLANKTDVTINIINALGQKVAETNYQESKKGMQLVTLPVNDLVPGNYFIVVKIGNESHPFKFVKE